MKRIVAVGYLLFASIFFLMASCSMANEDRVALAKKDVEPGLKKELAAKNLDYGASIFIRIFKQPGLLEVWLKNEAGTYTFFKGYDICAFSGELGPKLKEGDKQSPEGFYFVNTGRLNPRSRFHLSFNLGYPNAYDRYHQRTGSALMVHGSCVSVGCYAMTDRYIEEIYVLANAALENGQPFFRVHVFPFHLTTENLQRYQDHRWYDFWLNLQEGYRYFEQKRVPPNITVASGTYHVSADSNP